MSIYRSTAGKRALEAVYADAVDRLGLDVEDRRIDTRHGETHVLEAGAEGGPPILVFQGGNATNPMTLAWYAGLADNYRLIAPDTIGQPGHSAETRVDPRGDGYGEWVVDLLDGLGIDSAPMIGTSYGAGIVLRTAAFAPDRIGRAALVVPAGFGTGPLSGMTGVGVPAMLYRILGSERVLDRVLRAIATEADPDPVVRDTIAASLRYVDLEREFPEADADELEGFTAPVALVAAADDPFFPADAIVPRARDRIPELVTTEVLAGEKHLLSAAAQTRTTAVIRDFLDG